MYSDDEVDAAHELRSVVREFVRRFELHKPERTPCDQPMSLSRAHGLMTMYDSESGLRISDLADKLYIDMSNVSRLCDRLENDGLIERRTCPDDGRAKRLYLTARGRTQAEQVDTASLTRFASILTEMPEGALGQVLESIKLLNKAIEAHENA